MNRHKQAIINYLTALSFRERLLLLLIILAVIFSVWDGFVYSKQIQYHQQLIKEQQKFTEHQLQQQVQVAEEMAILTAQSRSKAELEQAVTEAKNRLQQSTEQLNNELEGLVPPTKITELLHSLLLQTHGLKLIALNNEPVEAIIIKSGDEETENIESLEPEIQPLKLYKHSTTMTLLGSFQQLYEYLQMIEQSEWSLYWNKLEYQVTTYPKAKITIRVHTVSTDQYWIGL